MQTLILDIQRGSMHDGPGIRTTVFLKGCPIKCAWCHNPESQSFKSELSYNNSKCTRCKACAHICENNAIVFNEDERSVDRKLCTACGNCLKACAQSALNIYGKSLGISHVLDIIKKDMCFYEASSGGVTISGGEPLAHKEYCTQLLKKCKDEEIHTCIETSGFANLNNIDELLKYTDLILLDYKVQNSKSQKYLGVHNTQNAPMPLLRLCKNMGKKVILRCPIIPTVNDNKAHFDNIIKLLNEYENILHAEILPYHNFGVGKATNIGKSSVAFTAPSQENIDEYIGYFKKCGCEKVFAF